MRGTVEEVLREPGLRECDRSVLAGYPKSFFVDYVPRSEAALGAPPRMLGPSPTSGRMILPRGEHINFRYEVKSHAGQGTFSNVYLVIDHRSWRTEQDVDKCYVVIKISREDRCARYDRPYEKAARRECMILNDLVQHGVPGIMAPIATFSIGGHVCTVLPKMDCNLYQCIRDSKTLSTGFVLWFLRESTATFSQAHAAGWVHADIKPENYTVNVERGRRGSIGYTALAVIDWGSAREIHSHPYPPGYVQSRYYRAPEVVDRRESDVKIDVWSMGCVAYEVCTGRVLFQAKDEAELRKMHLEWPKQAPKILESDKLRDPLIREYIARALVVDPGKRATAADLLALLVGPLPDKGDQPAGKQHHKDNEHNDEPPGGRGRSQSVPTGV